MKYICLAGVSGSGKTTLMENMVSMYPSEFHRLTPCTTRPIRPDEDPDAYFWLTDKQYSYLEHIFITKSTTKEFKYGTLPKDIEGSIGIIPVNKKGVESIANDPNIRRDEYLVIGLDVAPTVEREGRDQEFIEREREVLELCDAIITLDEGQYATPDLIKVMVHNFMNPNRQIELEY